MFVLIFTHFAVPPQYQHKVLFWGILGALVMRASLIGVGAAVIETFHWVLYLFGAFLIFTGLKMLVRMTPRMFLQSLDCALFISRWPESSIEAGIAGWVPGSPPKHESRIEGTAGPDRD